MRAIEQVRRGQVVTLPTNIDHSLREGVQQWYGFVLRQKEFGERCVKIIDYQKPTIRILRTKRRTMYWR